MSGLSHCGRQARDAIQRVRQHHRATRKVTGLWHGQDLLWPRREPALPLQPEHSTLCQEQISGHGNARCVFYHRAHDHAWDVQRQDVAGRLDERDEGRGAQCTIR